MTSDSTILPFRKPGDVEDPLTAILRDGAPGGVPEGAPQRRHIIYVEARSLRP